MPKSFCTVSKKSSWTNKTITLIWCSKSFGDFSHAKFWTTKEEITLRIQHSKRWETSSRRKPRTEPSLILSTFNFTHGFCTGSLSTVLPQKTFQTKAFSQRFWPKKLTEPKASSWRSSKWNQNHCWSTWLLLSFLQEDSQIQSIRYQTTHWKTLLYHLLWSTSKKETKMCSHSSFRPSTKIMTSIKLSHLSTKWPRKLKAISCWTTTFSTSKNKPIFWSSRPNASCSEPSVLTRFQRFCHHLSQLLKTSREIFKQKDSTPKLTKVQKLFLVPSRDKKMWKSSCRLMRIRFSRPHNLSTSSTSKRIKSSRVPTQLNDFEELFWVNFTWNAKLFLTK